RRLAWMVALVWMTATGVVSGAAAGPAAGGKPSFGADVVLPGGQGAEPSIAIDASPTASRGDMYVGAIGDPNAPLEWHSYDGGKTFVSCIQTFGADPSVTNCAENTIPARALAIDPTNFSLNFLYSCSTAAENLQHPPFGPLHDYYLAQSLDGGLTWTTHRVFVADTSGGKAPSYANIFGTLAIDSAGNYYALFDGTADDDNADRNPYHVYLEV